MLDKNKTTKKHEKRMRDLNWKYIERPIRLIKSFIRNLIYRTKYNNRRIIAAEVRAHRGRLVLFDFNMGRLLGWEDGPEDYYYIYVGSDGKIHGASCVCGFIPLYGKLSNSDYWRTAAMWNLNYPSYAQGLKMAEEAGMKVL